MNLQKPTSDQQFAVYLLMIVSMQITLNFQKQIATTSFHAQWACLHLHGKFSPERKIDVFKVGLNLELSTAFLRDVSLGLSKQFQLLIPNFFLLLQFKSLSLARSAYRLLLLRSFKRLFGKIFMQN